MPDTDTAQMRPAIRLDGNIAVIIVVGRAPIMHNMMIPLNTDCVQLEIARDVPSKTPMKVVKNNTDKDMNCDT